MKPRAINYFIFYLTIHLTFAQGVEFKPELWTTDDPEGGIFMTYMGRKSLFLYRGFAMLNNVTLTDGVIEVDINAHGNRGFPGIVFRAEDNNNHEVIYLRPYKSGAPDVIQYMPRFNGVGAWQLYFTKGYIASAEIPQNKWFRLKVEIAGKKASVYLNDSEIPSLVVKDLKRDVKEGKLGLWCLNGAVHFSNFKYTRRSPVRAEDKEAYQTNNDFIANWKLSEAFKYGDLKPDMITARFLDNLNWVDGKTDEKGLLNIAKYRKKLTPLQRSPIRNELDDVIARATVTSDKKRNLFMHFGYSDKVSIMLNGKLIYTGNSSFRSRSPGFSGIVGLNESISLPLKKGKNELLMIVTEQFGGWGLITKFKETSGIRFN